MGVFKDKKSWKAEIYLDGRRIKSKCGFDSKKKAKLWHDATLAVIKVGGVDEPVAEHTFDNLLVMFEKMHMVSIRPGTAARYLIDINQRLKPYFAYYKLSKITTAKIEMFRAELCKELSIKSVNNCLALLKTMMKKAVDWKMIPSNPAAEVALLKIPKAKYNWWDKEEYVCRFLARAKKDRYYLAYRLALDLGLRLGEIIGLSRQDINLDRCQIHIHRQWLDKEKKYGPTKGNKDRYITYSENSDLGRLLREAIENSTHKEALFITRTGRRLGARKLSGYHFAKIAGAAKVPKIRFHDLRHTFASWYMIKSDDIWSLKGILGHADIQTTQRYAHLSASFQKVPEFGWG